MDDVTAASDDTGSRLAKRWRPRLRILLPLAVVVSLLALHVIVVVPFQHTLWIIRKVETSGLSSSVRTEPGGPGWLRNTLSADWTQGFDDITRLGLHVDDHFDTARLLRYLRPHARVQSLTLDSPTVCDEDFGRLECLPNLQTLRFEGGIVTDDGMRHLQRCESLSTLQLAELAISDNGMQHLRHCGSLTTLHLRGLKITAAGIEPIGSLTSLEDLEVQECPGVTDDALRHLTHAAALTELRLSGEGFTDDSLRYLADMKQLKMLDIVDTGITTEGATRLSDSLPQCTIVWSDDGNVFSNRIGNMLGN